jgi:hypothetical protein
VRRLTFDSASALGLYDRGLLRPGLAADLVVFDPDTVGPLPESIVHDFPANGWRVKEPAQGIMATIVNGEVLLQDGEHTGALPGKVLRNTRTTMRITPERVVSSARTRAACGGLRRSRRSGALPLSSAPASSADVPIGALTRQRAWIEGSPPFTRARAMIRVLHRRDRGNQRRKG